MEIVDYALRQLLLAASVELEFSIVGDIFLRIVPASQLPVKRISFHCEQPAKFSRLLCIPLQQVWRQLMCSGAEAGCLACKAMRVEDELPFTMSLLCPLLLLELVPHEVLAALVDHRFLVLHQAQSLDPCPLQLMGWPTSFYFCLLFGTAAGGGLLYVYNPVDR